MRSEISMGLRSYGRGFAVRPSDDPPDELPDDELPEDDPLDDGDTLDDGGGSGDRLGRSRAVGPGDEPPGCVYPRPFTICPAGASCAPPLTMTIGGA